MTADKSQEFIAERRLAYSVKGDGIRKEVVFRVSRPHVTDVSEAPSVTDGNTCTCEITIDGLNEPGQKFFGMDSVQAIQLASDLDPLIRRLSTKYDFYWSTGEPYFDPDERDLPSP